MSCEGKVVVSFIVGVVFFFFCWVTVCLFFKRERKRERFEVGIGLIHFRLRYFFSNFSK